MKKRIWSMCLAVLLVLQLAVPWCAAAGTELTVSAPGTLPAVGQTFTVTVDLSGNTGFSAAQFLLAYNDKIVSCTGVSTSSLLSGMLSATNPHTAGASTGAMVAAASASTVKGDGQLATFTFTVLAAGDPGLLLQELVLSDTSGKDVACTVKNAAISSGSATTPAGDDKTDKEKPDGAAASGTPAEAPATGTGFHDVSASYWASAQIMRAAQLGLVTGFSDGTFHPEDAVTRAQFVTMLWRMAGKPAATKKSAFTDVPAGQYYADALDWAAEHGYVTGTTGGRFEPNGSITRQQAMAILFRYSGGQSGLEAMFTADYDAAFTDSGDIAAWAKPAVYWAVYQTIVTGATKTTIAPNATATRAQIAVIFLRYLDKFQTGEETA